MKKSEVGNDLRFELNIARLCVIRLLRTVVRRGVSPWLAAGQAGLLSVPILTRQCCHDVCCFFTAATTTTLLLLLLKDYLQMLSVDNTTTAHTTDVNPIYPLKLFILSNFLYREINIVKFDHASCK